MDITHVFFDIGGVLGTNGWDREQRARAAVRLIFQRALGISRAESRRSLFIDDRDQNLVPARLLGFRTLLFTDAAGLRQALTSLGLL